MERLILLALVSISISLSLAAISCGGGDGGESRTVIEVKADDYKFLPNEVTVPAGQEVTIKLKNVTKQAHDLEVQRLQVEMMGGHEAAQGHAGAMPGTLALHTEKGKTVSATFKADLPGTYEFWCTISGHKEQGMVGKLVVTSGASGTLSNPAPISDAPSSVSPSNTAVPSVPVITLGDGGHEGH